MKPTNPSTDATIGAVRDDAAASEKPELNGVGTPGHIPTAHREPPPLEFPECYICGKTTHLHRTSIGWRCITEDCEATKPGAREIDKD